MARLYPFRALRYDPTRVNLTDVVTQPYDKITPAMQDAYYAASPYNLIRVILGKHNPTDTDAENVYTRAAATLNDWRNEGILKEESEPALYGYAQTYKVPGTDEVRERRGFIAPEPPASTTTHRLPPLNLDMPSSSAPLFTARPHLSSHV